jgi:hypothetical protein
MEKMRRLKRGFPRVADIGNIWPRTFFKSRLTSFCETHLCVAWSLPSGGITGDLGYPLFKRLIPYHITQQKNKGELMLNKKYHEVFTDKI